MRWPQVPSVPMSLAPLLRPSALLRHLLVAAVAVTCVLLGQWQLDRLAEVRESNERATARLADPAADLAALASSDAGSPLDVEALEYRRVEVTGTYRTDEEVLQRNQELHGRSGFRVLTPLELEDGGVVLVIRGWVPPDLDEPPVAAAAPPTGVVTVTGVLERSTEQPAWGARDPEEGQLARVFHADTQRLDRQVDGTLFPMVLRTTEPIEAVTMDALPAAIGPPRFDEGNHLSYAMQWHIFGALAAITYGAWLWTQRRRGETGSRPNAPADRALSPSA
jgi:surfeit locus 1 family protein